VHRVPRRVEDEPDAVLLNGGPGLDGELADDGEEEERADDGEERQNGPKDHVTPARGGEAARRGVASVSHEPASSVARGALVWHHASGECDVVDPVPNQETTKNPGRESRPGYADVTDV
jgi:hypothetical protein